MKTQGNSHRKTGDGGEAAVVILLRKRKCDILAVNYSCRFGEIDIIAADRKYIMFVEVKTRSAEAISTPGEAVDFHKQRRLVHTASLFLAQNSELKLQPRFDVAEVFLNKTGGIDSINYIDNAFDAGGF